jgi:hypothetical protein
MSELTLEAARRIDSRRIALALAGIWAVFVLAGLVLEAGHGGWTLRAFDLADSNLEARLSLPASFTALLLLVSAGMAFALTEVDRTRRRRTWQLAGLAFGAFGLEKLVGLHPWLDEQGVSWTFAYLPLLALGGAALYRTIGVYRSQRVVQALFAAAVALWGVAGVLDNPDLLGSNAAAQIVGMAAATLFAYCLVERLRYLARQYYPLEERDTRLSTDQILAEAVDRLKLRPLAIGLVLLTGAFAVQEVLLQTGNYHGHRVPILDFDGAQTIFAAFQGALIAAAGLLALVTGSVRATPAANRRWWTALGAVLLVIAMEEITAIPNRFEDATGASGQILLIPFAVIGLVALWKVLGGVRGDRRVRTLLVAGTALWISSQTADVFLQEQARWIVVPEETAETLGSACWLFAFAYWLCGLLPVELMPLPPIAPRLDGPAVIEPLPASGERVQASTG